MTGQRLSFAARQGGALSRLLPVPAGAAQQVFRGGAYRVVSLPVTAASGLISTSLIIGHLGGAAYGVIMLIAGLPQLLGFADLGLGAGVTNATAEFYGAARSQDDLVAVLRSTVRVLVIVSAGAITLVWMLAVFGLWPDLLGVRASLLADPDAAVAATLTLFLIAVPLGINQRILLGAGRNDINVVLGTLSPLVSLGLVGLLVTVGASTTWYPIAITAGGLAVAIASAAVVVSAVDVPWSRVLRQVPHRRRFPSTPLRDTAGPALVIAIALPLALQSDRVVLAHLGKPEQLASYSLASQVYFPIYSLVSVAGMALWPVLARLREEPGALREAWARSFKTFLRLGLAAGIVYLSLAAAVTPVVGRGEVPLRWDVFAAFAIFLVVQSSHLPTGMALTDADGLRFQARCVSLMVVVNLILSVLLTSSMGAAGPVIASAIAVFLVQLVPGRRRMRQTTRVGSGASHHVKGQSLS